MLQTYPVRQPPQGERGADEVAKLPGAVIGGGIVVNVIMNVLFVYMGTDEELILALCPAHRRFIADAVGLLRRHLAVRERLPDLEEQGMYAEVAMEKEDWKKYMKEFVKQILECKPEAVYVTADLFAAYPVVHALRKKHMPVLMRAKKEGKTRIVRLPSGS